MTSFPVGDSTVGDSTAAAALCMPYDYSLLMMRWQVGER